MVIIEVKQIGQQEFKKEDRDQLSRSAFSLIQAQEGYDPQNNRRWRLEDGGRTFLYGVLTNGNKWEVYDFTTTKAGTAVSPNPCRLRVDLAKDKEGLRKLLSEIGKNDIDSRVERFMQRQS